MEWYRVSNSFIFISNKIRKVEVEKETPKYIIIGGVKHKKVSRYDIFFPTLEMAYNYLEGNFVKNINNKKGQIEQLEKDLQELKEKYKPQLIKLPYRRKKK